MNMVHNISVTAVAGYSYSYKTKLVALTYIIYKYIYNMCYTNNKSNRLLLMIYKILTCFFFCLQICSYLCTVSYR